MKKIAYIELDTHAEIANNFLELSKEFSQVEMDFYFSEKIIRLLSIPDKRILPTSAEKIIPQLQQKKYDAVIIGTTHRYFSVFKKVCEDFPTSIIVHNLNFSQLKKWDLLQNIWKKDWQYRLKLWWKEGLLSNHSMYSLAKNILVLGENLDVKTYPFQQKTKAISVFYHQNKENRTEKLKIVIPGAVSLERRDYTKIFSKLKGFSLPMEIVFLGKASGEELSALQKLKKELPKQLIISYFEEKVSHAIFEKEMLTANVLWCPLQPSIAFFSNKEIYGKTKISGNISDAIKFGKPAIFPAYYPQNYPFIFTEKENIEQQIMDLKDYTFDFQKDFSKTKIAAKLESILLGI